MGLGIGDSRAKLRRHDCPLLRPGPGRGYANARTYGEGYQGSATAFLEFCVASDKSTDTAVHSTKPSRKQDLLLILNAHFFILCFSPLQIRQGNFQHDLEFFL